MIGIAAARVATPLRNGRLVLAVQTAPCEFRDAIGGQVGFMWTFAQSAKPVNPPGTKPLAAAMRFSPPGPK